MSKYFLDGRAVDIIEVEHLPGEGSCVYVAHFVDTGTDLDDAELDRLAEQNATQLSEDAFDREISRAEAWADSLEDR